MPKKQARPQAHPGLTFLFRPKGGKSPEGLVHCHDCVDLWRQMEGVSDRWTEQCEFLEVGGSGALSLQFRVTRDPESSEMTAAVRLDVSDNWEKGRWRSIEQMLGGARKFSRWIDEHEEELFTV